MPLVPLLELLLGLLLQCDLGSLLLAVLVLQSLGLQSIKDICVIYRVSHLLMHLGWVEWVELNFGMGIWQKRLSSRVSW